MRPHGHYSRGRQGSGKGAVSRGFARSHRRAYVALGGAIRLRYGILGPLEVSDEHGPIDVSGAKQRILLAVLLLNANRVVSKDELAEALWEGRAPEGATKALQVHVSQLRKTLGGEQLLTRPPGYVLRVVEGSLDLDRFESLVSQARGCDPQEAARGLRDALSLWRGPPLADFVFDRFAQASPTSSNAAGSITTRLSRSSSSPTRIRLGVVDPEPRTAAVAGWGSGSEVYYVVTRSPTSIGARRPGLPCDRRRSLRRGSRSAA